MKILLVDESPTIRNIQKNVLRQLGHEDIAEASDGIEALTRISEQRPDLMLVDWNMPRMNGIALVRKIRETDRTLPIIMCTSKAEKSRVVEAVRAGVSNYVVKPFTTETLGEKITQTMARCGVATGAVPESPPTEH